MSTTTPLSATDLSELLSGLSPRLNAGRYVFVQAVAGIPPGTEPIATVREDEGLTLVLSQQQADEEALPYTFVAAWITLEVRSALEAVGLTAVVSTALAEAGISANVMAGFSHDHLFVPYERAADAVRVLTALTYS